MELSCIRFELEDLSFCRLFGIQNQNPDYKRNYYGLGCTTPELVYQIPNYEFCFTPNLNLNPKNYFHTDLHDNYPYQVKIGETPPAEVRFREDELKKRWKVNTDINRELIHNSTLYN